MTRYYTLKYNGNIIKNQDKDLIVGQCIDADLKLKSDNRWEDENFFVIRYNKESSSWYAIKISDNVNIKINGLPLGIAQKLENSYIIEAEDSTIKFNILEDSSYNINDGIVISRTRLKIQNIIALVVVLAIMFFIGTILYIQNKRTDVNDWNLSKRERASVRKIHVNGIYLQEIRNGEANNIDSISYSVSGTCFIARNGMLITARHCIQPWLELNPKDSIVLKDTIKTKLVKFAMKVETDRVLNEDSIRLVSKIEIEGLNKTLWSCDFNYNIENDLIINNGTRSNPQLWRSIRPSYHKRNNELGDIAWIENCGVRGHLKLADEECMKSLIENERINILGYSKTESNSKDSLARNHPGTLIRLPIKDYTGNLSCCFFHDDNASKGDSGGPVLVHRGHNYYVIAVYSRKDEYRGLLSGWSVPISEIRKK